MQIVGNMVSVVTKRTSGVEVPNHHYVDLRTSYVEFVLSFFKFGDANVKKDILQVKDLVSPIFKGLERDAYQV
jgi:hypothetical protein